MTEIYRVRIWIGGGPLTSNFRFLTRDPALKEQQWMEYEVGIPAAVVVEKRELPECP